ncbi:MAG TPA: hypothetical protein VND90_08765 [Terracidiphilus sp.]|nr:hypothetical protein [Terracidiphilus sp.]
MLTWWKRWSTSTRASSAGGRPQEARLTKAVAQVTTLSPVMPVYEEVRGAEL